MSIKFRGYAYFGQDHITIQMYHNHVRKLIKITLQMIVEGWSKKSLTSCKCQVT